MPHPVKIQALGKSDNTDERRGFHYVYHVSFPKLRVYNGERLKSGVFNLTIIYRDKRHRSVARRIVRSLDF